MDLIFVEEIEQITQARTFLNANTKIIALSPKVLYTFEKIKIPFSIPEDYYDNNALQAEWVVYFDLSQTIISEIDKRIIHKDKGLTILSQNIKPLAFNAQMFLNMFRQVVINIFILSKIFEKEKPLKVFYPETKSDNLTYRLHFEKESVVSQLIPIFAKGRFVADSYGWNCSTVEANLRKINRPSLCKSIKKFFEFFTVNTFKNKNRRILVFYDGYDLDYIILILKNRGCKLYYFDNLMKKWPRDNSNKYYNLCFSSNDNIISLFEYLGINFFPVVKTRMEYYLDNVFPKYMGMYPKIKEALKKFKIDILISSHSPSRIYENILCACAKEMNIKVVSFQHGCYGHRFDHILHINDFDNPMSDYFFAWGEGVRFYAEKYKLNKAKIVPVGSAWIDNMRANNKIIEKVRTRERIVLYVPTSLRVKPKTRMLPGEFPDNSYFLLQRRIISSITKIQKIKLWVKLHPSDKYSNPIANFRNYHIVSDNLEQLLYKVDLVVSDFMSTTLIESLSMNKNIMFYIDQTAMLLEPEARMILEKSLYCYDELTKFLEAISDYAEFPDKFPRKDNKEFLSYYGTYLNDGKSAERAVECIDKILAGVL